MSYEEQLKYKYHILIDGNAASYSASGWKFFSNSLVFKPQSPWIQWYYNELKPYVHYLPVEDNLEDLIDKIIWVKAHDSKAEEIAHNSREFALRHLTLVDNLVYLYYAIDKYSRLEFIDEE